MVCQKQLLSLVASIYLCVSVSTDLVVEGTSAPRAFVTDYSGVLAVGGDLGKDE
jgi:hypothetical protein